MLILGVYNNVNRTEELSVPQLPEHFQNPLDYWSEKLTRYDSSPGLEVENCWSAGKRNQHQIVKSEQTTVLQNKQKPNTD